MWSNESEKVVRHYPAVSVNVKPFQSYKKIVGEPCDSPELAYLAAEKFTNSANEYSDSHNVWWYEGDEPLPLLQIGAIVEVNCSKSDLPK